MQPENLNMVAHKSPDCAKHATISIISFLANLSYQVNLWSFIEVRWTATVLRSLELFKVFYLILKTL